MTRSILNATLLLALCAAGPSWATPPTAPDFLHRAWPLLKPIFEQCACEHYGVDEVLTWEDREDPRITFWLVMAVADVRGKDGEPIPQAVLVTMVSFDHGTLRMMSVSKPFRWTPDLQLVHEREERP